MGCEIWLKQLLVLSVFPIVIQESSVSTKNVQRIRRKYEPSLLVLDFDLVLLFVLLDSYLMINIKLKIYTHKMFKTISVSPTSKLLKYVF